MVSTTKTIVSRSAYESPACKLYSITVEGVIAQSNYGEGGEAGGDSPVQGGGDDY